MKNKFYLTNSKIGTAYFVLSLLFCGLFASSLQAQVTHNWKAGVIGLFSNANNWETYNTATWATTGSSATTLTAAVTAIPASIAINDVITGGNITNASTLTVSNINAGTRTITFTTSGTPVTPTAAATYTFTGLRTSTVPGAVNTNVAQINSGTCTIDASPALFRTLTVGNTSTNVQGKLIINTGFTLSLSANGGTSPILDVKGGLVTNNGVINATGTAANSQIVRFLNATAEPDSDWGIVGSGTFTLAGGAGTATSIIFFNFLQTTVTRVPRLVVNTGSTVAMTAASTFPAAIFAASSGAKASIEGTGITHTGLNIPTLFGFASGSTVDVASTVVLTNNWQGARGTGGDVSGTLNNYGSISYITGTNLRLQSAGVINNFGKLDISGSLNNAGNIINKSTPTATGSLTSAVTVTNCTQERYLASNQRGWRLLSNPAIGGNSFSTIASTSTTPVTLGLNSAKTFNTASNTWTTVITALAPNPNWNINAIALFIRGRTSEVTTNVYNTTPANTPSNVTLSIRGSAPNTAPSSIATGNNYYYLVNNPYTAPISVAGILAASTNLSTTISYYDPTVAATSPTLKAGGYRTTTVSGAAGSATDVVIPPMGSLFLQGSANGGTLNIPKSAIFTGTPAQPGTYNHKQAQKSVAASLKIEVKSDNIYYDMISLVFKSATDASSNINFGKLNNDILDAYSFAGKNKMAVSELDLTAQTIPLGITSFVEKSFTFKVDENTIPAGYEAVLIDKYLNKNIVLAQGAGYDFTIDSNPASQGDARFEINLKIAGTLGVAANELDSKIKLWPNPARSEVNIINTQSSTHGVSRIEISNLNGQLIHTQKSNPGSTTTIQTKNWAKGVYILKASNNGTETTKKLIIQ